MKLHVLYRITGSDNQKRRPAFYSKRVALRSFLAALDEVDSVGDVQFFCDGPVSEELGNAMRTAGTIVELAGLGNAGSYRRVIAEVRRSTQWSHRDLVYFAEDDYLYRSNALQAVCAAARALRKVDFFTPYDHPDYSSLAPHLEFERRHPKWRWMVEGQLWHAVRGTTMTFAARVGAMRRSIPIHERWSHGEVPHDWEIWSALTIARQLPRRRHVMVAPLPSLATHIEEPFLAAGVDWQALARTYES